MRMFHLEPPRARLRLGLSRSSGLALWAAVLISLPPLPVRAAGGTNDVPPAQTASNTAVRIVSDPTAKDAVYDDIAVFTEALLLVRRQYAEEKPFRDLIYGAIDGMLTSLDPHSGFLQPEAFQELSEETSGHFSGIGIHVGIKDGTVVVLSPIEDSPATRAGLMAGDRLIRIDRVNARGISMDETVRRLRGAKGTSVVVTVEREGRDPFDVTLVRDDVKVASVRGVRLLRNGVGYLRLTQFVESSGAEFARALQALLDQKMSALVLDLRDNPGGLLSAAVESTGQLLPSGAEIVSVRGRDGVRTEEHFRADGTRHQADLPVVVLVNARSASAAEIMAGALQDHHRAVLVGETTFGKASVQNVLRLSTRPECAVRLTTAHYYTPAGRMIHGQGITPDIVLTVPLATWRRILLKRAYDELPEAYPATVREKTDDVRDDQLDRAVDLAIGARILGARK